MVRLLRVTLVGERHKLHGDGALAVHHAADQAAGLVRVVGLAMLADRREVTGPEHERHGASPPPANRCCSLR